MRKSQNGVMLIEALIGILIFSIGILALIGMQGVAMKNTTDARYRSEAAFLGGQLGGQIWVDRANMAKYDTTAAAAYAPRDNWLTTVERTLPGIDRANNVRVPTITVDAANNQVTMVLQWLQPGETQVRRIEFINRINGAI